MASSTLFSAVRRGDAGTVRALLFPGERGLDDESADQALSTSLPRQFKVALNSANPNHIDPATQTAPLHQAVLKGDLTTAALLLRHKATNILVKDGESGWTPMHQAVYNGDVAMAMLLARHGGAVMERDKEGNSWADLLNVGYLGDNLVNWIAF
jgi:ankyrin repeat protein